jgi:flagellar basal body-associated protein FliL
MPAEMKNEQVREELDAKLIEIRSALREREDMLAIGG